MACLNDSGEKKKGVHTVWGCGGREPFPMRSVSMNSSIIHRTNNATDQIMITERNIGQKTSAVKRQTLIIASPAPG